MRNDIPAPNNPATTALLKSNEMRTLMHQRGAAAQAIYRDIVARRTGRLAASASVDTFIEGDRWCTRLTVGAPYAASHEYGIDDGDVGIRAGAHDLNIVLNQLGQL